MEGEQTGMDTGTADTSSETTGAGAAGGVGAETSGAEAGEYVPNFGFKAYDKKGEIEEWARGFITDKATEDRFRSLYAKAGGFDHLRGQTRASEERFQSVQNEVQTVQATLAERDGVLDELKFRRDSDLGSFFEYAGIPENAVIDWVESHLKFLQKPDAEQAQIKGFREQAARARELEKENNSLRASSESSESNQHVSTFNELCDHPEVAGFASKYDSVAGKPGAFRAAVINYGDAEYHRTGKTIPPLEAIRTVYRQFKPFIVGREGAAAAADVGTGQSAGAAGAGGRRPVIPSVGGGSAKSPARRVFTSVEELKAHHANLVAAKG